MATVERASMEAGRQAVRAQAKYVRSSARKARLVTDLIRGRTVPEARTILAFSDRAVARDVERVLRSAVANAESRPDLLWQGDDLLVATAYADEGPTLKRHRARARGRVGRIMKRTCHITIELVQGSVPAAAEAPPATRMSRLRRQSAEQESTVLEPAAAADAAHTDDRADVSPRQEPEAPTAEPTLPQADAGNGETTDADDSATTDESPSSEPQAPDGEEKS